MPTVPMNSCSAKILNRPDFKNGARVQAYTAGYEREVGHVPHLSTALGGQVTWYGVPEALKPTYGTHPVGVVLFLRLRAH